jgi:hypothetical protein
MSVRSFHFHDLTSLNSNSHDIINIITLCVILISALTVTHGQRSNFTISLPVSGLPFPLLAPRLSPHSFLRKLYKGDSGELYCLPAPCFRRCHHCCTPCAPSSFSDPSFTLAWCTRWVTTVTTVGTQHWLYDSKVILQSSYLSKDSKDYKQRSLAWLFIRQRKEVMLLDIARITWPKRPEA